jgi:hypothetical protein
MSRASIGKARSTHKVSTTVAAEGTASPQRKDAEHLCPRGGHPTERELRSGRALRKHAEGMPEIRRLRFEHRRVTWRARRHCGRRNTSHVHPASPGARYNGDPLWSNNGERTPVGHDPLRDPRGMDGA